MDGTTLNLLPHPPVRRVSVSARAPASLACVYCRDALELAQAAVCLSCRAVAHDDCASELRGCPTLGCRERYLLRPTRVRPAPEQPRIVLSTFQVFLLLMSLPTVIGGGELLLRYALPLVGWLLAIGGLAAALVWVPLTLYRIGRWFVAPWRSTR